MLSVTKRKPFTKREDDLLKQLVKDLGDRDWSRIAKRMPHRTAKQCRDRYKNYLSSDFKVGPWSESEVAQLKSLVAQLGPRWVEISQILVGRSPNDIKNRWYKHIVKERPVLRDGVFTLGSGVESGVNLFDIDEDQISTMFSVSDPRVDGSDEQDVERSQCE